MTFNLDRILAARADDAVGERAAALAEDDPIRGGGTSMLLEALGSLDLTLLQGDDSAVVKRLCARARRPLPDALVAALGLEGVPPRVAAVCVRPNRVEVAVAALAGSGVAVASVAGDFPSAAAPFPERVAEARRAVSGGAGEIDAVMDPRLASGGEWAALYDEVQEMREACGGALLKTILRTGDLPPTAIARASRVALMAGSDFIKTSTGMEVVNATLSAGVTMATQIRRYHEETGWRAGLKPAGGIRTASEALAWVRLRREVLGPEWVAPDRFRIGASALVDALERALDRAVGR